MDPQTPEPLSEHDIYRVYRLHIGTDVVRRQLAARYVEHAGQIHVLEDHFGLLKTITDGPVTARAIRVLASLRRSSYFEVVSEYDETHDLNAIPAHLFPEHPVNDDVERPASRFRYTRDGQDHFVEFRDGAPFMNGHRLDDAEATRLLEHHQSGVAQLNYAH